MDEIFAAIFVLDGSIAEAQQSIDVATANGLNRTSAVADLLSLLTDRYELMMDEEDLERGISLGTTDVQHLDATDPNYRDFLGALSKLLALRYSIHRTDLEDIDTAITYANMSLSSPPQESKPDYEVYHDLALFKWEKYIATNEDVFLDQYIQACEDGVRLVEPDEPYVAEYISMCAKGFEARFDLTKDVDVLQDAIKHHEAALDITPEDDPDRLQRLTDLGICLGHRFERTGAVDQLDRLIQVFEEAEGLPSDDNTQRGWILNGLGGGLKERYLGNGQSVEDLERAISISEDALSITPNAPETLTNLGTVLLLRFRHSGDVADLDRCVELIEKAQAAVLPDDPSSARFSAAMAEAYGQRFHCKGDLTDLEKALEKQRKAVATVAPVSPRRFHMQMSLADHLHNLYQHSEYHGDHSFDIKILEEAIAISKRALEEAPRDDRDTPTGLASYGNSLLVRFRVLGDISDLDEAIRLTTEAVSLAHPMHKAAGHSLCHNANANCFKVRFLVTGKSDDLDHAIDMANKAVQATRGC